MNPFLTQKPKTANPFIGISGRNIEPTQDTVSDSLWSQIASGGKALATGIAGGVGGLGLTAVDYLGKKAVGAFGTEQMKQNIAGAPTLQEQFGEKFGEKEHPALYGTGQVIGEIATLAAPVSTVGKGAQIAAKTFGAGEKTAKLAQAGAEGLAFTKGIELAEQKPQTLEDYAINAGLNIAIPGAGMALKAVGERAPERIIDSLIKPLLKDFAYGKEPGKTVAQLGITANTFDDLVSKIKTKKDEIGQSIGSIISRSKVQQPIDLAQTLKPIDEAITKASFTPRVNASLLQRLDNVKADLQEIAQRGETLQNAQEFKGLIGDMTKWTGNATDDAIVNKALKNVYGSVRNAMDDVLSKTLTPEEFNAYKTATKQYGDLMSAENAAVYRDKLTQRQDLISFGARNAGLLSALATAVGTGGASIPTLIAGLAGMGVEKGMATPAFKTRLASLLSKLAPKEVSTFFEKVPTAKQLFKDTEIKNFIEEPKAGLSIAKVFDPVKIADKMDNLDYSVLKKSVDNPSDTDAWIKADNLLDKMKANKLMTDAERDVMKMEIVKAYEERQIIKGIKNMSPEEIAMKLHDGPLSKEDFLGKTSPAVGQTADLVEQAKKFDTPEEFVRAQGEEAYHGTASNFDTFDTKKIGTIKYSDWGEGIYLDPTKSGADYYRREAVKATNREYNDAYKKYEDSIKNIEKINGIPQYSEESNRLLKEFQKIGKDLYTTKEGKVIDYIIDKNAKTAIYTTSGSPNPTIAKQYKDKGYDVLKIKGPSGGVEEILVLNPDVLKTRAQLSAIWKQAHNK